MCQLSTPPPSPQLQTMSCEKWLLILSSLSFPICDRAAGLGVAKLCPRVHLCQKRNQVVPPMEDLLMGGRGWGEGKWSGHGPVLFVTGGLGSHEQEAEEKTGARRE